MEYKVEWTLEGTFDIEADSEQDARDKAEEKNWDEISETLDGYDLKVKQAWKVLDVAQHR